MSKKLEKRSKILIGFRITLVLIIFILLSGGFFLAQEGPNFNLYRGYQYHLDIILTIENPLTLFENDAWKRSFGLFDMILSFLFIPFAMTLL